MFSTDDIFVLGDNHNKCDDYSSSGILFDKYPYIVISDGCSASDNSDIGSRILVRATVAVLQNSLDMEPIFMMCNTEAYEAQDIGMRMHDTLFKLIAYKMASISSAMGLDMTATEATLRVGFVINGKLCLFHYGDGYTVLMNHTTGEKKVWSANYPSNAPFYPSYPMYDYITTTEKTNTFVGFFGDDVMQVDGKDKMVREHVYSITDFFTVLDVNGLKDGDYTLSVMSDGVETFYEDEPLGFENVIDDLISFKNFQGKFVQRKVRMYLHKLKKNNVKHYDDISVASIKFNLINGVIQK